jgi:hypothetical protein
MRTRSKNGVAILGLATVVACGTGVATAHTRSAAAVGTTPPNDYKQLTVALSATACQP